MTILSSLKSAYTFLRWPLRLTLSFVLGILFSWTVLDPYLSEGVPQGAYAPLITISSASFQMNMTLTTYDKPNNTVTTWIRADSGMLETSQTIFTRLMVSCNDYKVAVYEQRLYGPFLAPVTTFKGTGVLGKPASISGIAAVITLCGFPDDDPKKAPSADPKEDHQDHDPGMTPPRPMIIPKGPTFTV